MNITEAIAAAAARLEKSGVAEHRREASSLLRFVLDKDQTFLIAHPEYVLSESEESEFNVVIERRAGREPYHYIVGTREFYGLDFEVSPGVLIPRPETEILVEDAIAFCSNIDDPSIFEIGVGSGCISISLLYNLKNANGIAVDISSSALEIAAKNARRHGVFDRLKLCESSLFDNLEGRFDLIVSNPPYIPDSDLDGLQKEVVQYEPHSALFGGADGLGIVRQIVAGAPDFLKPGGRLLIEIGFGQAEAVEKMFDTEIWSSVDFLLDFQGISRVARADLRTP
ncbi:peptide chain release factor N(5)-glutamine methyltransferase [soil metagenome]